MIEFILGGARSGKSRLAEQKALQSGRQCIYIATASAMDEEMQRRIEQHKQSRKEHGWQTIEEPLNLAQAINQFDHEDYCILVDCLTLWLSNHLCDSSNQSQSSQTHQTQCEYFDAQKQELITALKQSRTHIILVSNETGMGVVPMGQLSREFVDQSGWLHQQIAALADRVILTVAGLPHILKDPSSSAGVRSC